MNVMYFCTEGIDVNVKLLLCVCGRLEKKRERELKNIINLTRDKRKKKVQRENIEICNNYNTIFIAHNYFRVQKNCRVACTDGTPEGLSCFKQQSHKQNLEISIMRSIMI